MPDANRPTTLQDAVIGVDREILRLLARRASLLHKLRARTGRLDATAEKALRAAWEHAAARLSSDPRLCQQLFALLQEVEFLPKPGAGEERRPAFNLAPVRQPVDVRLTAPLESRRARLYLTLAAVSGCACRIVSSLLGDDDIAFVKMFNQLGASLAWEDAGALFARQGGGVCLADRVIFTGSDPLNFFLVLSLYLGHPSHAKFTGDGPLKTCDYSALRHFLPQLGARLTNVLPKSNSLPVRVECSGILPEAVRLPGNLPADMLLALALAQPFWPESVLLDMREHPQHPAILAEALPLLADCGVNAQAEEGCLRVTPGPVHTPYTPPLCMDTRLAAWLLALVCATGGTVRLEGRWPEDDTGQALCALLRAAGAELEMTAECLCARAAPPPSASPPPATLDARALPTDFAPLALALAALGALRGASAPMPLLPETCNPGVADSFLRHVGLEQQEDGSLCRVRPDAAAPRPDDAEPGWSAPDPFWALALSLAAFAKSGTKLANPGIVSTLAPAYWGLYNALPCPEHRHRPAEPQRTKPVRRRILAGHTANVGDGAAT